MTVERIISVTDKCYTCCTTGISSKLKIDLTRTISRQSESSLHPVA